MEYTIRTKSNAVKIELNDRGDYIAVHPDNAKMFENFANGRKKILSLADEMTKWAGAIEKEYEGGDDEASQEEKDEKTFKKYVEFSEQFIEVADGIFGSGTIHKYFADNYDEVCDFVPGVECAEDFFEQITPAIEQIFNKHLAKRRAAMDKYRPQDYKRPQKRAE